MRYECSSRLKYEILKEVDLAEEEGCVIGRIEVDSEVMRGVSDILEEDNGMKLLYGYPCIEASGVKGFYLVTSLGA